MLRTFLSSIGANRVVIALSLSRLGDALGNSLLFTVIPLYVAEVGAPLFPLPQVVRSGLLLSFFGLVNSICQPFMGASSDRINRRKPFISGGMLLMAASVLAFAFASEYWNLLLFRSLQGIGFALVLPASMALMATSTEHRKRGGAMGFYTTMRMFGFTIGPLLGGFIKDHLGFNSVFYTGAFFLVLGAIMVQLTVRDAPAQAGNSRRPFQIFDRQLLSPGIAGLGFATLVMAVSFTIILTLEKEFNQRLHLSAFGFGLVFSALMVTRLLFQIPFGKLSDRIGRKPLIIGGLIVMAPVTALLGKAATETELIGLRLLQGLASAAIAAPAFALAADLSTAGGEGRQMSIVTMGFTLGIAIGPLLSGMLALFFFELPFLAGAGLLVLGAWLVHRFVPETIGRTPTGLTNKSGTA